MQMKKIINYDLRPILKPNGFSFATACIFKKEHVRAYLIQSSMEKAKIEDIIFNMPKKKYLSSRKYEDLENYQFVLSELCNTDNNVKNLNTGSTYTQYVFGKITIEKWMESTNHLTKWHQSKNEFNRSIKQLKQGNIVSASKSSKKAYKLISSSGLFLWNRNILTRFEQADSLLHVLTDTYLLSRISKRLKYYNVLHSIMRQVLRCLTIGNHLYEVKQFDICQDYFSKLKERLVESIINDLAKFRFDEADKRVLNNLVHLYTNT